MQIINAKIHTMDEAGIIENGFVRVSGGLIDEVGPMDAFRPDGGEVIDAAGAQLLPGFIDAHTHLGMWEDSLGFEGDDGNEDTDPCTPHLRAVDAVNPLDRAFSDALKAGVTTVATGPGSANPVAGQSIVMKTMGRRVDDMLLRDVGDIKFALGENPKMVYHGKNQTPTTRMATAAIIREQLHKAQRYMEQLAEYTRDMELEEPEYDIRCEALLPLLQGNARAYFHAHRSDDIFTAVRIAKEFGLASYSIVHCTEGYRIADILASEAGLSVLCGPLLCDRSKPELSALDPAAPGILHRAGVKVAIVTDHPETPAGYLATCAGLAVREGMDYDAALEAITIRPAEICGVADRVGSIRKGKDADLVLFDQEPLSILSKPVLVLAGGVRVV